jgi:HEAT repeat protein
MVNSLELELPDQRYQEAARNLGTADETERIEARKALLAAGKDARPVLVNLLANGNKQARLEAATALGTLKNKEAAPALVRALENEDHDVRWAVRKALINLGGDGLEPLLIALMHAFDCIWLREGAHYILNDLKKKGELRPPLLKVLHALEGIEPAFAAPWAAEKAWEALFGPKKTGNENE